MSTLGGPDRMTHGTHFGRADLEAVSEPSKGNIKSAFVARDFMKFEEPVEA